MASAEGAGGSEATEPTQHGEVASGAARPPAADAASDRSGAAADAAGDRSGAASDWKVIVVVGPPGAGKTTVATQLAERLGLTMRDTDADIEADTGATIADLFVERGEQEFRKLEEQAVQTALEEMTAGNGGVLALGGGAVLSEQTRTSLKASPAPVVLLEVGLAQAVSRVGLGATRPLLLGNIRATLKRLLDERAPLYREVADIVVDTNDLAPEDVTDRVVELLNGGAA